MVCRRRKSPTKLVSITKVSTIESSELESVSMSYVAYAIDCIGDVHWQIKQNLHFLDNR